MTDLLFPLSQPFTSALTFPLCVCFPPHLLPHLDTAQILPCNPLHLSITSLSKPNQSKISLPLLFRPPQAKLQYQHWHM